jgi:hypothetical protein
MTSARESQRISAIMAGLAATVGLWTFAAAYAPAMLENIGGYSPWLYGPASTAAWALFSAIAYLLIRRSRFKYGPGSSASYRCPELGIAAPTAGLSVCANRDEKNRLSAVTAGFALTLTGWVAALSFMPEGWFDFLTDAPVWFYCVVLIGSWTVLSVGLYLALRASARRPAGSAAIRTVKP